MFDKKRVEKQIKKLSLEQGDLIVLRTNKGFREWIKVLEAIIKGIKDFKKIDVTALVLPEDIRFGSVSEKEMNTAGWFKQDREEVQKIIDENDMLHQWNTAIKELHVEDALKNYDIIEGLKERLKKYEDEKG
jgi:hypothetical protein